MPIAAAETDDLEPEQLCPSCGKMSPLTERIGGVCSRCKGLFKSVHGKVLGEVPEVRSQRSEAGAEKSGGATHWDEQSQRIQTTDDAGTSEAVYQEYCRDFAVNMATAMEQAAFWANHFGAASSDESGAAQALARFAELITRGFTQVQLYEKHHGDRVMAERCMWLLLDFHALAGADTYEGLVKLLGHKKQTVNKCMQFFQSQIPELPILPGQRDEVAKENISKATRRGWHRQRDVASK